MATETELLQELIGETRGLRRQLANCSYLFTVPPDDVNDFKQNLEAGRVESLQTKFQKQFVELSCHARIYKQRDGWKISDLRSNYYITKKKEDPRSYIIYGVTKPISYIQLKYESGLRTITSATTQPSAGIGTYPDTANYPNLEEVHALTRSEQYPLGRNAPELYVINYGPGKIYILSSADGVIWSYAESMMLEGDMNVFTDVYALAIRTDSANTKYRASEYHIETARISKMAMPTLQSEYQTEWDHLWASDILPPKATTIHTAYTVPTGYRLLLKGAMVSASKGGMHRCWIIHTPGILGDCRFQFFEALTFPPSSEIAAGDTLLVYYKNNCSRIMRGTVSFIGVMEKTTV